MEWNPHFAIFNKFYLILESVIENDIRISSKFHFKECSLSVIKMRLEIILEG